MPIGLALAVALAACATTSLVNNWKGSEYARPAFNRTMVIGVTRQPSTHRIFEDEFVARINTAGIDSAQSFALVPEDGPVGENRLYLAVEAAQAKRVISARLVKVEQKVHVTSGHYRPAPHFHSAFMTR